MWYNDNYVWDPVKERASSSRVSILRSKTTTEPIRCEVAFSGGRRFAVLSVTNCQAPIFPELQRYLLPLSPTTTNEPQKSGWA